MASKINLSRHWGHISSDTYDIPAPSGASAAIEAAASRDRATWRDTDTGRARRQYARDYMRGKGVAFLGMGCGSDEVNGLRAITPHKIRKEHERARGHTPSAIVPGLRTVRRETVTNNQPAGASVRGSWVWSGLG